MHVIICKLCKNRHGTHGKAWQLVLQKTIGLAKFLLNFMGPTVSSYCKAKKVSNYRFVFINEPECLEVTFETL